MLYKWSCSVPILHEQTFTVLLGLFLVIDKNDLGCHTKIYMKSLSPQKSCQNKVYDKLMVVDVDKEMFLV